MKTFLVRRILGAPAFVSLLYVRTMLMIRRTGHSVKRDRGIDKYFVESSLGLRVYVSDPRRLLMYSRGINYRLRSILDSYCLTNVLDSCSIVVDCGANIGELGFQLPEDVTYIAVDPDPATSDALRVNCPRAIVIPKALWEDTSILSFSLQPETADTSAFPSGGDQKNTLMVQSTTVDHLFTSLALSHISLLKVEAEGAEPEVLRGSLTALKYTDLVAIDVSPERSGMSTIVDCFNLLYREGFEMIASNTRFQRFLFRNVLRDDM